MLSRYVKDNAPIRAKIVQDIINRVLKKSDIVALLENDIIKANLSNVPFLEKKNKSEWTRTYLEGLFYHSKPRYFSKEFLLYLDEVAEYITNIEKENTKNTHHMGMLVGVIVVILLVFLKSCLSNTH